MKNMKQRVILLPELKRISCSKFLRFPILFPSFYQPQYIFPLLSLHDCFHLQYQLYNKMKESSGLGQSLQHQILEAYQEKNFEYLPYSARRGSPPAPLSQMSEGTSQHIGIHERSRERKTYPFTAFGVVESFSKKEKKIGIGAIIHPHLIITLAQDIVDQVTEVWFYPLADEEKKYLVKRVHPTSIKRRRGKNNQQDPHLNLCAILEIERKVDFEQLYGSFSINFECDDYSQSFLMGLRLIENTYHQRQQRLINPLLRADKKLSYHLQSNDYAGGSLVINKISGEYEIVGIHLSCSEQGSQGILLTKQYWKQLKKMTYKAGEFDFNHNTINRKGLQFLKELNLKRLTYIDLQNTTIGREQLKNWSQLKCKAIELYLGHNGLDNICMEYLADFPWPLQIVSLSKNLLTFEGVRSLSKAKWRNLVFLELERNTIGSKGAQYLSQGDWRNLEEINLRKTELGDMGCEKLRKAYWPRLTSIQLNHNRITQLGVMFIVNANWKRLSNLSLASNQLRCEGVKQVVRAAWHKTKSIRLQRNQVDKKMQLIRSSFADKFTQTFLLL